MKMNESEMRRGCVCARGGGRGGKLYRRDAMMFNGAGVMLKKLKLKLNVGDDDDNDDE